MTQPPLRQAEADDDNDKAGELRGARDLAERERPDQQRERRNQRRIERRARDAKQHHGAGEEIDRGGAGKSALHHRLQQIFGKAGGDHVAEVPQQDRQAGERQYGRHRDRPHGRDLPQPEQHAENRKTASGGDKQKIADHALPAHRAQGFGADHAQTGKDRDGADDAARRQRLFQNKPRQDHAADRGAGRLDDGAVAERHEQVADITEQRERQPAG
jgi:hypothetical protein